MIGKQVPQQDNSWGCLLASCAASSYAAHTLHKLLHTNADPCLAEHLKPGNQVMIWIGLHTTLHTGRARFKLKSRNPCCPSPPVQSRLNHSFLNQSHCINHFCPPTRFRSPNDFSQTSVSSQSFSLRQPLLSTNVSLESSESHYFNVLEDQSRDRLENLIYKHNLDTNL